MWYNKIDITHAQEVSFSLSIITQVLQNLCLKLQSEDQFALQVQSRSSQEKSKAFHYEYEHSVLNRVYDLYILFKHRQGIQCTYDVTVRGVRETAVAVEM
jgi:hypothetical protein